MIPITTIFLYFLIWLSGRYSLIWLDWSIWQIDFFVFVLKSGQRAAKGERTGRYVVVCYLNLLIFTGWKVGLTDDKNVRFPYVQILIYPPVRGGKVQSQVEVEEFVSWLIGWMIYFLVGWVIGWDWSESSIWQVDVPMPGVTASLGRWKDRSLGGFAIWSVGFYWLLASRWCWWMMCSIVTLMLRYSPVRGGKLQVEPLVGWSNKICMKNQCERSFFFKYLDICQPRMQTWLVSRAHWLICRPHWCIGFIER